MFKNLSPPTHQWLVSITKDCGWLSVCLSVRTSICPVCLWCGYKQVLVFQRNLQPIALYPENGGSMFLQTLVLIYQSTQCNNLDYHTPHFYLISAGTAHYTISKNTLLQHKSNGNCVLSHYNLLPCCMHQSTTCSSFSPYKTQTCLQPTLI